MADAFDDGGEAKARVLNRIKAALGEAEHAIWRTLYSECARRWLDENPSGEPGNNQTGLDLLRAAGLIVSILVLGVFFVAGTAGALSVEASGLLSGTPTAAGSKADTRRAPRAAAASSPDAGNIDSLSSMRQSLLLQWVRH